MLKNAVNDAADTERRLDNMRHKLLFLRLLCLRLEGDHFARENELLAIFTGDRDRLLLGDSLGQVSLRLLIGLLEVVDHLLLVFLELLADYLFVQDWHRLGDCDSFR